MRALGLFLAGVLCAQDPLADPGWVAFYNLDFETSIAVFRRQAAAEPQSAGARNHLAQALLYREMYRSGALESELVTGANSFVRRPNMNPSPEVQRDFEDTLRAAMALASARLAAAPRDREALYALGVSHGLRANYNFLVRREWLSALRDATEARKLHRRAVEADPEFLDARLVEGLHDYIVGSLPLGYRMLGFLAGFHGDRNRGIRTLEEVVAKGVRNRIDAQVLLAAIYRRDRQPAKALPLAGALAEQFPRNVLYRLELSQMHADLGERSKALDLLADVERRRAAGEAGYAAFSAEKLAFLRGNLLFWFGSLDGALEQLTAASAGADRLDLNAALLAWMRLGQTQDLRGERDAARAAYGRAIALAPQSEIAAECRSYLKKPYRRKAALDSP